MPHLTYIHLVAEWDGSTSRPRRSDRRCSPSSSHTSSCRCSVGRLVGEWTTLQEKWSAGALASLRWALWKCKKSQVKNRWTFSWERRSLLQYCISYISVFSCSIISNWLSFLLTTILISSFISRKLLVWTLSHNFFFFFLKFVHFILVFTTVNFAYYIHKLLHIIFYGSLAPLHN